MTEVAAAARTANLGAQHAVAGVVKFDDIFSGKGLEKTRPAGAGMEFRLRAEERQVAARAKIHAVLFVIEQRAAEWCLRALRPQNSESVRAEHPAPFFFGFFDSGDLRRREGLAVGAQQADDDFVGQFVGKDRVHGGEKNYDGPHPPAGARPAGRIEFEEVQTVHCRNMP